LSSKIDAGLELISALGATELKPIEIRDLLYNLITKDYNTIDKILEIAQKEKLLQQTEKTYLVTPAASSLEFEKPRIIRQEERGACRLCRKNLSTGYYVVLSRIPMGLMGHPAFGKYTLIIYCKKKANGY